MKKNTGIKIYSQLMRMGYCTGCHQRRDRSFFYKGYQFPVCARCTGVLCSYLTAIPIFLVCGGSFRTSIAAALVMLADWSLQHWKIRESTNLRRFITGVFGGYGIMTTELLILEDLLQFVKTATV